MNSFLAKYFSQLPAIVIVFMLGFYLGAVVTHNKWRKAEEKAALATIHEIEKATKDANERTQKAQDAISTLVENHYTKQQEIDDLSAGNSTLIKRVRELQGKIEQRRMSKTPESASVCHDEAGESEEFSRRVTEIAARSADATAKYAEQLIGCQDYISNIINLR